MHFRKEDMEGTRYNWVDEEKHLFTGQPSRRTFDRSNGNQVLFLINSYASLADRFTIGEGRTIEHKIQHDLPLEAKSEISVLNWLKDILISVK